VLAAVVALVGVVIAVESVRLREHRRSLVAREL
jgi:hypothetical protein